MVNWQSAAEIKKDGVAFENLIYTLFGLYVWEITQTFTVEWSMLVTRTRPFKWPMSDKTHFKLSFFSVFYFLCRYCLLFALIGLIISFNVTNEVNCAALYTFNSWTGNMAILCASTSLMIRTIAIWERRPIVLIPLIILCLGHWGLLYHGIIIVRATWDSTLGACIVNQTDSAVLKFTFFATMGFDLIIFIFTCAALLNNSSRSGLWHLLFRDGLIYWVVTFSVNAIPAILNSLDLNTPMNIIATVPAATVSAIAACRCVVRLQDYRHKDTFLGASVLSGTGSSGARSANLPTFEGERVCSNSGFFRTTRKITRPEVHIRTDQITMENISSIEYDDSNTKSAITPDSLETRRDLESGIADDIDVDKGSRQWYGGWKEES